MLIFKEEEHRQFRDIERCPYAPKDSEYREWIKKDNKRLLLIALDRYAEMLIQVGYQRYQRY